VVDFEVASQERCKSIYDAYYGRRVRHCESVTQFVLSDEERLAAEAKLEKQIEEDLRYDMAVRLVPQTGGGYTVVGYNRRQRDDVRGLCDPSLVAFTVANFTAKTNWRSRSLHVWLRPLDEGWGISTAGSRKAIRKGRSASSLGWLGVIDIPAFRAWLEQGFRPLAPKERRQ
jgi:hypothetical protein